MARGKLTSTYEDAVAILKSMGWTALFKKSEYRGVARVHSARCACGNITSFRPNRPSKTGRCIKCKTDSAPPNSRKVVTQHGTFPSISAAARHYGINVGSLVSRFRMGWSDEEACELVPRIIDQSSRDPQALGFIYRIKNVDNGMLYVGLTSNSVENRWKGHQREARYGSSAPLHQAIRKFGKAAFKIDTLIQATVAELPALERKAIHHYGSDDPLRGYNGCPGGGLGGPSLGHMVKYAGRKFVSRKAFADHLGLNYELVRKMFSEGKTPRQIALHGKQRSGTGSHCRKQVVVAGKTYSSIKEACEALGTNISKVNWRLRNGWSKEDAWNPANFTRSTSPNIGGV
jgi:hypothetical protein